MKPIEKDIMVGMISILNQAIESNRQGTPIISDENFNIRLTDLKQIEDETGVVFTNSPNCEIDIQSLINIQEINKDNLKDCKNASEIVEFAHQKETVVYLDINSADIIATYTDGCLTSIQTNDVDIDKKIKLISLPYKINKNGIYTVRGKIAFADKPIFYVDNIIVGDSGNIRDDFNKAEELNFDVVPFWFADSLNPNKLQGTIDYVLDYITDDGLDCNGIIFKFNEKKHNNILNYVGCYYDNNHRQIGIRG